MNNLDKPKDVLGLNIQELTATQFIIQSVFLPSFPP